MSKLNSIYQCCYWLALYFFSLTSAPIPLKLKTGIIFFLTNFQRDDRKDSSSKRGGGIERGGGGDHSKEQVPRTTSANSDVGNRVLISQLPPNMSERKLKQMMQSVGDVEVLDCFFIKKTMTHFLICSTWLYYLLQLNWLMNKEHFDPLILLDPFWVSKINHHSTTFDIFCHIL